MRIVALWLVETAVFTEEITRLLSDEGYRALQLSLILRPDRGRLIPGSGGLRKLRWPEPGRGRRGGLRVIYCWDARAERIYFLWVYRKSRQEDLTPRQLRVVRRLAEEELS